MIERDVGELPIELHQEGLDEQGRRRFTATSRERIVARFLAAVDQSRLRVAVDDVGAVLAERQALVSAITALARSEQLSGVVLAAGSHLLLRYAARAAGFTGPLRSDLVCDFHKPLPDGPLRTLQDQLLAALTQLLPGVEVVVTDHHAGRLRSILRSAASGVAGTVHLSALDATVTEPLRLAVPVGADVMAEGVALTIDTALAVRRRFHPLVDQVRIFYDQASQGLRNGKVAGVAEPAVRDVHLSPAYASVGELETLYRDRREGQSPLMVLPPFTRIDSVVAHEYWHQIEFGLEGSRYRDSIEFRRALGGYFGVETLEHVIKGAGPGAPPAWQAARIRLAREVSAYATTAPKEAAAELFAQWWCTVASPPPSAVFFGDVLGRLFPADPTR